MSFRYFPIPGYRASLIYWKTRNKRMLGNLPEQPSRPTGETLEDGMRNRYPKKITLGNGKSVVLRPLERSDEVEFLRFFAHLLVAR